MGKFKKFIKFFSSNFFLHHSLTHSYLVHVDENGDAAGNYTILARKTIALDEGGKHNYGLFPIGTFSAPDGDHIPVYFLIFIFNCFH